MPVTRGRDLGRPPGLRLRGLEGRAQRGKVGALGGPPIAASHPCPLCLPSLPARRNGLGSGRTRTESEPSCGSPVVSGDPKEDHNYSSAKSAAARSASPASDSVSSSSAEDHYEFAPKGSREGSEGGAPGRENPGEAEEDERRPGPPRDAPADGACAAPHKKRQHLAKARRVPSDTLPLKKRRTEKPPESDDEEMKEAAGSLLHLAGIRSCLNNITNRTAKGQKEQKETTKN